MRNSNKLIFLLLIFLCSFEIQSQTINETKKKYHYTFEGNLNAENLTSFEQRLSQLPFVNWAKVKYKSQAGKGEFFIETTEPVKTNEGDKIFEVTDLKKLIQSFQLTPGELNIKQN
ncbi:MAG: hypothetical protein H0W61_07745 [Bacteroidetes bacterium]|nr:hypothetical protein [Bacteroidota bacterium]